MRRRSIVVALTVTVAAIVASVSFAAHSQTGKVKVVISGANNGKDVRDGSVSGRGHFTARGAITDSGTVVAYRTVKGNLATGNAVITLRFVTVGKKGAITYVARVVIMPATTTARWSITSATKRYKGLRGSGREYENADHTVAILSGTVTR